MDLSSILSRIFQVVTAVLFFFGGHGSHGCELGLELHKGRRTLVRSAAPSLDPRMPAFGFNWWRITVITVTKHLV